MHECLIAIDFPLSDEPQAIIKKQVDRIKSYASVHFEKELSDEELKSTISKIDAMLVARWPGRINKEMMLRADKLKLVQSLFAGVDAMPFDIIPEKVTICSNAGAYSEEVSEFAMSLLLSAAKSIPMFDLIVKEKNRITHDLPKYIRNIQNSTLGILGYGGIGRRTAQIAKCMGMKILVYSRRTNEDGHLNFNGLEGLKKMLPLCDFILLALPLTKHTRGLINQEMLNLMKEDAIFVNVARGDIVDYKSLASHLEMHPNFKYATDVGWIIEGKENYDPEGRLFGLMNYTATPHVSGYSSQPTGRPLQLAVDNIIRFYSDSDLINRVDRSEYS